MTVIHDMDVQISHTGKRILYFQTEDRHVIRRAVDQSAVLWERLTRAQRGGKYPLSDTKPKGERYQWLKKQERFFSFEEVYFSYCCRETQKMQTEIPANYQNACFFTLQDFQVWDRNQRQKMVKAFLEAEWASKAYLLISAPHTLIPDGFGEEIELIRVHPADLEDISQILKESLKNTPREWELLETAKQLKGLSESQIRGILRSLQGEYGISCGLDAVLPEVQRRCEERMRELIRQEKEKAAEKDPTIVLMDYDREQRGEEGKETPERAVGLDGLCQWLENRRDCFLYPDSCRRLYGVEPPKGILVTGIPGTGKTLMAEEAARRLDDAALIRFQIDRIQSSSYGESESNMRRCLERIESMAPCVLLIDEAEKIFRMDEHTHEVKLNMLGQLLDWMQKRKAAVFTFMTANGIRQLPPELLRDGRISERFFAFMPSGGELAAILCEKLRRIDRETRGKLFDEKLRERIQTGETGRSVVKRIGELGEQQETCSFFTGANAAKLIAEVNNALRLDKRTAPPYTAAVYEDRLVQDALKMRPHGQTNMNDIVNMWLEARENQYLSASGTELLPFAALDEKTGMFDPKMSAVWEENPYDRYLTAVIGRKIAERYREMHGI